MMSLSDASNKSTSPSLNGCTCSASSRSTAINLPDDIPDQISLKEIKRLTKHLFGQANVITVPRILIDLTGDHISAILLNQIIYWSERTDDEDGWFYKDADAWQQETAITYRQLATAMKKLRALGVETCVRKIRGAPTTHYRIDLEKFTTLFLRFLEIQETRNSQKVKLTNSENDKMSNSQNANFTKGENGNSQNVKNQESDKRSISMKGTKTTTKNTNTDTEGGATASPPRECVSRFDEKTRRAFARNLASQKFIRNPDGYAISIADGRADSLIQEWKDSKSARAVEVRPDPDCDYCEGTGTMRVRDDGTAVKFDSPDDTRNVKKCQCRTLAAGNGKANPQASDHSDITSSERERIKQRRRKRDVDGESEKKSA